MAGCARWRWGGCARKEDGAFRLGAVFVPICFYPLAGLISSLTSSCPTVRKDRETGRFILNTALLAVASLTFQFFQVVDPAERPPDPEIAFSELNEAWLKDGIEGMKRYSNALEERFPSWLPSRLFVAITQLYDGGGYEAQIEWADEVDRLYVQYPQLFRPSFLGEANSVRVFAFAGRKIDAGRQQRGTGPLARPSQSARAPIDPFYTISMRTSMPALFPTGETPIVFPIILSDIQRQSLEGLTEAEICELVQSVGQVRGDQVDRRIAAIRWCGENPSVGCHDALRACLLDYLGTTTEEAAYAIVRSSESGVDTLIDSWEATRFPNQRKAIIWALLVANRRDAKVKAFLQQAAQDDPIIREYATAAAAYLNSPQP